MELSLEWVSIYEDMPQKAKGSKRISIDVDCLLKSGKVVKNCFATLDDEEFFNEHGKRVRNVVAWRTML